MNEEPEIPARRRPPLHHLKAAAKSGLGSNEERYSIAAAQAEALVRTLPEIVDELRQIRHWLHQVVDIMEREK